MEKQVKSMFENITSANAEKLVGIDRVNAFG